MCSKNVQNHDLKADIGKVFSPSSSAEEFSSYSVITLVIVIVAPVIVLIVLSAIAILVFRRIHHNQMERLTSRDAEYGTIDGLIASNVGESTLAVSSLSSSLLQMALWCLWGYHDCMRLLCQTIEGRLD